MDEPLAVETAIAERLASGPALTAIAEKIFPVKAPQGIEAPYLTYQKISSVRETAFGADPGIARARYQLTSWHGDFDEMKTLAVRVRERMQRWRETVGEIEILDTFIETDQDLWDEESSLHYNVLDVILIHREPA